MNSFLKKFERLKWIKIRQLEIWIKNNVKNLKMDSSRQVEKMFKF